jgi:hypothetical protein
MMKPISRQREHQLANPQAHQARGILGIAIKAGKIIRPTICSHCDKKHQRIEGHHFDYGKPLVVTWVCPPCHSIIHPHHRKGRGIPKKQACYKCGRMIGAKSPQPCISCRTTIWLICTTCGTSFSRKAHMIHQLLKNKPLPISWFCSKSCSSGYVGRNFGWNTEYQKARTTLPR